jgi:hypothetical protein
VFGNEVALHFGRFWVVEDVVGGFGPREGVVAVVQAVNEAADGGGEVFEAGETAPADGLAGDDEEDFGRFRPCSTRTRWSGVIALSRGGHGLVRWCLAQMARTSSVKACGIRCRGSALTPSS